jgi:hypothetical protein
VSIDLDAWWNQEHGDLPPFALYAAPARDNPIVLDVGLPRLLVLTVHHPAAVGAVLMTVDPDTLGLPAYVVAALAALAQGAPVEQVRLACQDPEIRRRLNWIAALPLAAASSDPAGEARGLLEAMAGRRRAA